jgi:hypothetical protein
MGMTSARWWTVTACARVCTALRTAAKRLLTHQQIGLQMLLAAESLGLDAMAGRVVLQTRDRVRAYLRCWASPNIDTTTPAGTAY